MAEKFSWRFYQSGDEVAINTLYESVTGRARSKSQHDWQWLSAPAGQGDMALIFANDGDQETLIGHHGVMPIRFTNGDQDLLFGKIENTMVLPAYRDKILYPRFERRFKSAYESKYHALFATMGPETAIRVRYATGYTFPVKWQQHLAAVSIGGQIKYVWYELQTRAGIRISSAEKVSSSLKSAGFLDDTLVSQTKFFDDFWNEARHFHGIAPRRDKADLQWRFWNNPYKKHFTLIIDKGEGFSGYAIISIDSKRPYQAFLEDYAVSQPTENNYRKLFNNLFAELSKSGIISISMLTTDDPCIEPIRAYFYRRQLWVKRLNSLRYFNKKQNSLGMPRQITQPGQSLKLSIQDWAISGLIFEGRS